MISAKASERMSVFRICKRKECRGFDCSSWIFAFFAAWHGVTG